MKAATAAFNLRLLALAAAVLKSSSSISKMIHRSASIITRHHRNPSHCRLQILMSTDDKDELTTKFSSLRSIGVDYGLTRTGIAITTGGYRPRPLTILAGLNTTQLSTAIVDYVQSERATNIVLGLPLHKNGTDSEQSSITRTFGQFLLQDVRRRCGKNVDVVMWDERYTSREAASRIAAEAMARNARIPSASDLTTELDADAACIILEDYYKEMGVDAERLVLEDMTIAREYEEIYRRNLEREERARVKMMEERERGRNARREMMERDRAMEQHAGLQGDESITGGGKRKKKKKRKKKR